MNKTFTSLDLVRFLYCETNKQESEGIAVALESDGRLNQEFQDMQQAYSELSKLTLTPSNAIVRNILKISTLKAYDEYAM